MQGLKRILARKVQKTLRRDMPILWAPSCLDSSSLLSLDHVCSSVILTFLFAVVHTNSLVQFYTFKLINISICSHTKNIPSVCDITLCLQIIESLQFVATSTGVEKLCTKHVHFLFTYIFFFCFGHFNP